MSNYSDKKYVTGNSLIHLANTARNYVDAEVGKIRDLIPEENTDNLPKIPEDEFNEMVISIFGAYYVVDEEE